MQAPKTTTHSQSKRNYQQSLMTVNQKVNILNRKSMNYMKSSLQKNMLSSKSKPKILARILQVVEMGKLAKWSILLQSLELYQA
jgi:hypothetical protein